ncbi:alpha/beta fold hydrolase [Pseudonocardia alaniniphila]|uniref:Alpha/beta hydrolase n=1 Tax=Pseudonocardia alaniniphila TaxID=75291 RepID=A0ABS9TJM6_9PSEU|nr:alpha/beta fold hydrolase [Pseudonocardia alaniniphila]MCH6168751.1 alpha/beta hydrolase [Pseudonocardia alaniniphila]
MSETSPYASVIARVPVREDEVALRGGRTRLWIYGADDAAHRIVFLHGLRGDHHGLEPIVAHLPDARVVVPDLPGFGQSPPLPDDPHDVGGYAAWARDLLAAVAPAGDAVLAGHSFGSIVATAALARSQPPASDETEPAPPVRGLVLVNPIAASALAGPRVVVTRLAVLYHHLAAALPEHVGTALLRHPVMTRVASVAMATTGDRDLRRWIHAEHDRYFSTFADRRTLLEAFHASVGHDVGEFAGAVTAPTLLVAAERDDIAPPAAQRALVGRFPEARLAMVPGTGHLAHYETPDAVAAAMSEFLTALPVT